jgi:hypothetical protein
MLTQRRSGFPLLLEQIAVPPYLQSICPSTSTNDVYAPVQYLHNSYHDLLFVVEEFGCVSKVNTQGDTRVSFVAHRGSDQFFSKCIHIRIQQQYRQKTMLHAVRVSLLSQRVTNSHATLFGALHCSIKIHSVIRLQLSRRDH